MFGLNKKKTWGDYIREFGPQYDIAKVVIFQYLSFIFKETCKKPEFVEAFGSISPDKFAAQTEKYLVGEDYTNFSPGATEQQQEIIINNIPEWADEIMKAHKEFADLVTDTLNMYGAFQGYIHNEKGIIWSVQTEEGKKTMSLLSKYSDKTREQPTPESYSNLIKKWMRWSDLVDDQNYKSWLKS